MATVRCRLRYRLLEPWRMTRTTKRRRLNEPNAYALIVFGCIERLWVYVDVIAQCFDLQQSTDKPYADNVQITKSYCLIDTH